MELAVFSGRPAFEKPLYVGQPAIEPQVRERFHALMEEAFERRYLTNDGPLVQRFEAEIARLHGVEHCALVANATLGLILVMEALELTGQVILPSFTFVATAHACLWKKLEPVFGDIRRSDFTLDPDQVEALITPETRAVIGVHLFGRQCRVERLTEICDRSGLKLILDAAHAFGCTTGRRLEGGGGAAEVLSFHATKFFTTFEGGAVLTNDPELDTRIRLLRNFGFVGHGRVDFLGMNAKMSEASAAMGLASLPEIEARLEEKRMIHGLYRKEFSGLEGLELQVLPKGGGSNRHYLVALVDEDRFGLSRDLLYRVLWAENCFIRRYFYPGCHNSAVYRQLAGARTWELPVTDEICRKIICFPTNLTEPEKEVRKIGELLAGIQANRREINRWASLNPAR